MGAIRNVICSIANTNEITDNTFYATKVVDTWLSPQTIAESEANNIFKDKRYITHYFSEPFRKQHENYSFEGWKTRTGQNTESTFDGSPLEEGEVEKMFYNEAKQTKVFDLEEFVYRDLDGNLVPKV